MLLEFSHNFDTTQKSFFKMLFSSLLLAGLSPLLARGAPVAGPEPEPASDDAPVLISRQNGYIFSNWHEGNIQYSCNNGYGGSYTVNWQGTGGFVCGKGWSPGGSR
jgi:endo-1,4-beta-xylanase